MVRGHRRFTRTDALFPYAALFRCWCSWITYIGGGGIAGGVLVGSCCCALRRNAREASLRFGGIVSAIRIGINAAKRIVSAAADHAALGNRDACARLAIGIDIDRKSTRLNSSH